MSPIPSTSLIVNPGGMWRVTLLMLFSSVVEVMSRHISIPSLSVGHVKGEAAEDGDGQQAENEHGGAEASAELAISASG